MEDERIEKYIPDRNLIMMNEGKFNKVGKRFHKWNFKYNKEENCYICTKCKRLNFDKKKGIENKKELVFYNGESCVDCKFIKECSHSKIRIICRDKNLIDARKIKK